MFEHRSRRRPTSEFVVQSLTELSIQRNHGSCCTCISLKPGVALEVTETERHLFSFCPILPSLHIVNYCIALYY